jgi:aryl-phospho-beta-D-glucosidase BglC (GH1 family)
MPRTCALYVVALLWALPALAAGDMLPRGPLSTRGSQIIAADGTSVRIAGVGVFTDVSKEVGRIKQAGFNTLRIEWGNRSMLSDLPRIDRIIAAAGPLGLRVILDNHYNEGLAGMCVAQQANGLWYDLGGASNGTDGCGTPGSVTDARFVADWVTVAQRYAGNQVVIGYDIRNEPLAYGGMSTWEAGSKNPNQNLRWMYQRVGNAIQAVDPDKLIICEGPQNYKWNFAMTGPAPWGDLSVVDRLPVTLTVPNKVVYSIHDYPAEIAGYQPDSGPSKISQMNVLWGYLVDQNLAPVLVGEMGSNMKAPTSAAWAKTLTEYMNGTAPGGPTFAANEQPISGVWWWAGSDDGSGDQPSGIWDSSGALRAEQQAVWSRILYHASATTKPGRTTRTATVGE